MEVEQAKLDVALKLAELRKSAGLTQKQLAQKVGKPQSTISRVETGELNPSIELVIELAQGLDKKVVLNFE
ncbi:helix-turn-helix transcriptional regulator [Enterococcus faecalis]|nr:helix-turn-helix transcriptional regulator [Enterococcus faecalis]